MRSRDERPFELVSLPYMVKPNEARNLGVAETSTEYVVIADNDIEYEPGWLDALERHAVEHDSDAVAPLICIGPPAGDDRPPRGRHREGEPRRRDGVRLSRGASTDGRSARGGDGCASRSYETTSASSTACWPRRALLDEMGGLDERLITREQLDFAMRALVLDARVTFAEKAVVTYMARDALRSRSTFATTSSAGPIASSSSRSTPSRRRGVSTLDRNMFRNRWTAEHRVRAAETTYPWRRRLLGKERFRRWVVDRCEAEVVASSSLARRGSQLFVPRELPRERVAQVIEGSARDAGRRRNDWPQSSLPRVAGMATMPSRADTAPRAIASILPQVEAALALPRSLRLDPAYAEHERIRVVRSRRSETSARTASSSALAPRDEPCTFFSVDDDVEYPADYCDMLESQLDGIGGQSRRSESTQHSSRRRCPRTSAT